MAQGTAVRFNYLSLSKCSLQAFFYLTFKLELSIQFVLVSDLREMSLTSKGDTSMSPARQKLLASSLAIISSIEHLQANERHRLRQRISTSQVPLDQYLSRNV